MTPSIPRIPKTAVQLSKKTSRHAITTNASRTYLRSREPHPDLLPQEWQKTRSNVNHESEPTTGTAQDREDGDLIRLFTETSAQNSAPTYREMDIAILIASTKEALRKRESRERRLHRDKQRRYRQRQRDVVANLEQETKNLRNEVEQLQEQKRAQVRTVGASSCVWTVVAKFFRLFEFGLLPITPQPSSDTAVPSVQLDFLRSTLAPDVLSSEGRGVDAVIHSWSRASLWLSDFRFDVEGLHRVGTNTIIAITNTHFTLSERTLRNVFPNVWNDQGNALGTPPALARKLLGQSVALHGTTRFEWDPVRCCVTSLITQADLLTPLLCVLGNLEDVERVLAKALLSADFGWVAPCGH